MATTSHTAPRELQLRALITFLATAAAALCVPVGAVAPTLADENEGTAPRHASSSRPTVEAAFARESYASGDRARLVIFASARRVSLQIFRAGLEDEAIKANDVMEGDAVSKSIRLASVRRGRAVPVRVGNWPSGVYFARLTAAGGRVGYAPFILRTRRLGTHRVAVVLPTQTWQAYNRRDDDGDGSGDTWYASWRKHTARLARPFLDRGVPPYYKRYDQPFLRWLAATGRAVDYLSDEDLDAVASGRRLADAYSLIVFPGHHEYVTRHEYDVVTRYRNLGGNLMFLSADNFFWQIVRRGVVMTRTKEWRDLGRPEAALIGVQYFANDDGSHRAAWIVRNPAAAHGLLAESGLRTGDAFGNGGIEVDGVTSASPPQTKTLAELSWRHGKRAQMTYYETREGAKVFAAGAFTLAGSIWEPAVRRLMETLWTRLASDRD
jgi:hypothetical protein